MKDEIRLVLSKRQLKLALLLATLLGTAYAVQSENFTLTALYPSPSGVYRRLISTAGTILARDSGAVIIGLAPDDGLKLDVLGAVRIQGGHLELPTRSTLPMGAANGALYYDNALSKMRLYQDGWRDVVDNTYALSSTFDCPDGDKALSYRTAPKSCESSTTGAYCKTKSHGWGQDKTIETCDYSAWYNSCFSHEGGSSCTTNFESATCYATPMVACSR